MTKNKLIVALDVDSFAEAQALARLLAGTVERFKVGLQLWTAAGPDVVRSLQQQGYKVFLDLKFHDIPNTAAAAVRQVTRLGVDMITVHAQGGREMMVQAAAAAAAEAARLGIDRPKIIAVTILTSTAADPAAEENLAEEAVRLALAAKEAGADGVTSSAWEAALIKKTCGRDFLAVTPGIRPAGNSDDDQARVATPAKALALGSDLLVVGRPVIRARDPRQAVLDILKQMEGAGANA